MAGQETKVELMRKYPQPVSSQDIQKYSFFAWGVFLVFVVAVAALALYFAG